MQNLLGRLAAIKLSHLLNIIALRGVTVVIQLFYIKIYSNALTKSELGLYSFWFTVSYSLTAFVFLPLDQYQQTHLLGMRGHSVSIRSFLPANVAAVTITFGLSLMAVAGQWLWTGKFGFEFLLCFVLAAFTYTETSARNFINNLGFKSTAAMFVMLESASKLVTLFLFTRLAVLTPIDVVMTAGLAMLAVTLAILPYIRRYGVLDGSRTAVPPNRAIFSFCFPLAAQAALGWVQLRGVSFLAPAGYPEIVGIYFTVATVGQAGMAALGSIISQMFIPELLKSNGAFLKKYLFIALAALVFMLLFIAAFGPFVVPLLTGRQFASYYLVAEFGAFVEAGNLMFGGVMIYFQLRGRTFVGMIGGVIALVSCAPMIVVCLVAGWLTPYTIGAALAVSQTAALVYLYRAYRERANQEVVSAVATPA